MPAKVVNSLTEKPISVKVRRAKTSKSKTNVDSIMKAVETKVNTMTKGGKLDELVIEQLVEEKLQRRCELLVGAMRDLKSLISKAEKESSDFKVKKIKDNIDEVTSAIESKDFNKLSKMGY